MKSLLRICLLVAVPSASAQTRVVAVGDASAPVVGGAALGHSPAPPGIAAPSLPLAASPLLAQAALAPVNLARAGTIAGQIAGARPAALARPVTRAVGPVAMRRAPAIQAARLELAASQPAGAQLFDGLRPPGAGVEANTVVETWHGSENGRLAGGLRALYGGGATVLEVLEAYEKTPIGELIPGAAAAEVRTIEGSLEEGRLVNVIKGLRFPGTPAAMRGDVRRIITYDRWTGSGRIEVLNETGPLAGTHFDVRVTPDPEGRGSVGTWTLEGVQPWSVNDRGGAGVFAPVYRLMHAPSRTLEATGRLMAALASPLPPMAALLRASSSAPEGFWRAAADRAASFVSRLLTEGIRSGPAAIARQIDALRAAPGRH